MSYTSNDLPGMNRTGEDITSINLPAIPSSVKVILIGTNNINSESIFMNGLYQNVYHLYKLFELIGYLPYFFVPSKPVKTSMPDIVKDCRFMIPEDIIQKPIQIHSYIEVAMSVDIGMRTFMKTLGARIYKLYLGNILNIDIETPIFHPQMNFSHHIVGGIDQILVSPHYEHHKEYAAVINDLPAANCKTAPYLWEPDFLIGGLAASSQPSSQPSSQQQPLETKQLETKQHKNILIIEPNISFQKSSIIPLLIAEEYFNKHPEWSGKVIIYNYPQLSISPFFLANVLPNLNLHKKNRIITKDRTSIVNILKDNPDDITICHQVNNEYNYMILELLWLGHLVVHNGDAWSDAGFTYSGASISEGLSALEKSFKDGPDFKTIIKGQGRGLAWKYSIYNPDVQAGWKAIIEHEK
jgi:hypothetical protein